MAYTTSNASRLSILDRVQDAFAEVKTRYAQYRVYRSTIDELQDLSSRELSDLGLNASMIRSIAYEAAYK